MSSKPPPTPEEAEAVKRYNIMTLVRFGAALPVMAGLAIAQGLVDLPYLLGVVMALAGLAAFFFGPPLLVRRWKAADRGK